MRRRGETSPRARARVVVAVCGALGALLSAQVHAQSVNYEGLIIGESAAGMGGAFTAIADDASAVFHNPAGLGNLNRSGLSLSASTYGYQLTNTKGVLAVGEDRVDLDQEGTLAFPNALIYVLPLGNAFGGHHTLAVSVLVPSFAEGDGVQHLLLPEANVEFDIVESFSEQTYLIGPSYGVALGDDLAIGGSLFVLYRLFDEQRFTTLFTRIDTFASRLQRLRRVSGDYAGLTGNLGALYRPVGWLSLGARLQTPTARLLGSAETFFAQTVAANPGDRDFSAQEAQLFQDVFRQIEGDTHVNQPWSISMGGALRTRSGFRLSADARLYLEVAPYAKVEGKVHVAPQRYGELPITDDPRLRSFDSTLRHPGGEIVVNGALGASLPITELYTIMVGAFTDFSPVPGDAVGDASKVDQYGATMAFQRKEAATSTLTIGLGGLYGAGEAFGLEFDEEGVRGVRAEVTRWTALVFVGGSTPFGEDERKKAGGD